MFASQVLRLSSHSLNGFSPGSITNLLSNDAGQIEMTLSYFNFLWVGKGRLDPGACFHSSPFSASTVGHLHCRLLLLAPREIHRIHRSRLHTGASPVQLDQWSSVCIPTVGTARASIRGLEFVV